MGIAPGTALLLAGKPGWPEMLPKAWEELGFSTGEAAAPGGMVGACQAVPTCLLPAQAGTLPVCPPPWHRFVGSLTGWRWDDPVASGATALLG